MFDELTGKFENVFKTLRGQGKISESNVREALRDIRRALLEADVNFKVAKRFLADVEGKALGNKVLESITPGQMIVKIVHDELVTLLGNTPVTLSVAGAPAIIVVCGLQGSGKTTTVAKLARHFQAKGKKPFLSSVDIHRPAAIEQLRVLAGQLKIPFRVKDGLLSADKIAQDAIDTVRSGDEDLLIMDTAGRLHLDETMMSELSGVVAILKPHHLLFVADGMTGQDAVNAVLGFRERVDFDGVILTKMDGDTRGGAALSIREVTGKPILFMGTGERVDALEQFHPDRFASRILGMGDIVSLVEKAQETIDLKEASRLEEKIRRQEFNLQDFLDQLQQIKKMGPLDQLLSMVPGVSKALKGVSLENESRTKHLEAIIQSMTREEREKPTIIDGSRRKRIAKGSGTTLHEVNEVLRQFTAMQKMMKQMSKMTGPLRRLKGMQVPGSSLPLS